MPTPPDPVADASPGFFAHHGAMAPGVRLMRRLSMPVKAALVVTAFLVPLGMLGGFYWTNAGAQIEFAEQERRGTEWLRAWAPALRAAQEHRALSARAAAGDPGTGPSLAAAADAWKAGLDRLAEVDRRLGAALATGTRVPELQRAMQAVTAAGAKPGAAAHDAAIGALLAAGAAVGDSSNLVLDPDLDAFYLMKTAVMEGPGLVEALARLRDAGAALAGARDAAASAEPLRALASSASLASVGADRQRSGLARATDANAALAGPLSVDARLGAVALALSAAERALARDATPAAGAWWTPATAALDAAHALNASATTLLDGLLSARIERLQRDRLEKIGFAIGCVALAFYLLAAMYRVLQGGLRTLSQHIERLAGGDFSARPYPWGEDEIAAAMHRLRESLASMSGAMREVHDRAGEVSGAAREIATGNADLSARTEQGAAAIEAVAHDLDLVAQQVAENVASLGQADRAMAGLLDAVRDSESTVAGLVERMGSLHAQSRQISEIVGLIDGIAFQTNILALNASVEAARAGDMGRGFAVVAHEVRSLAQRSAEAAQQIKGIVTRSTADIETGSKLADQAGRGVAGTVATAGQVAGVMARVLDGSREQSRRVGDVHATLTRVSTDIQGNAALVEEVAAATGSLDTNGRELHRLVARFRLGVSAA